MKPERIPWHLLAGLILGLGLGLVISWVIAPAQYTDTPPSILRSDFKDSYRAQIAYAYAATGDLKRAETRLATLADADPVAALTIQAQRELASGNTDLSETLAVMADALNQKYAAIEVSPTSTRFLTQTPGAPRTPTPLSAAGIADPNQIAEPPISTPTEVPIFTRTPAATATVIPTVGAPYILVTQDEICSANISEGLLMVYVSDTAQKPVPGVEVIVEWEGNEEHFFTGLKPELGDGYADFAMQPNRSYALRLAVGSTATGGLSAPPCQDSEGNHYWGSLRLKFQRP